VWFGEALDPDVLEQAFGACDCNLFLAVGTSAIVYPAAGLLHEARRRGAFTVEINPDATEASAVVDLAISARAEDVLGAISGATGTTGTSGATGRSWRWSSSQLDLEK
jgi:NAD-dependent deacetylase